jgi:WD40 repeat protein
VRRGRAVAVVVSVLALAPRPVAAEMVEIGRTAVPADVKVRFLRVSPDGQQLTAACGDRKLRVWTVPAKSPSRLLRTLDVDGEPLSALAYSHDGTWIAASTGEGMVAVFRAQTGELAARVSTGGKGRANRRLGAVAISPDGSRVAVAPVNAPPELWDVASAQRRAVLVTPFAGSNALDFSPDGTRLASADEDTAIRLYDAEGTLRATVDDLPLETFALTFTPDGKQLVLGGADKRVTLLDGVTGKVVRQLPKQPDSIVWLAALRAGAVVVSGSFKDESMDLAGATLAWTLDGAAPRQIVAGQRFNGGGAVKDGRLLLTTMAEGAIVVWAAR